MLGIIPYAVSAFAMVLTVRNRSAVERINRSTRQVINPVRCTLSPMSNNSTKKQKTSLKQLQAHISTTIDVWDKTAKELESKASKEEDKNVGEVLFFAAAIYRTCGIDLKGVLDGKVILDKADKPFQAVEALANA